MIRTRRGKQRLSIVIDRARRRRRRKATADWTRWTGQLIEWERCFLGVAASMWYEIVQRYVDFALHG